MASRPRVRGPELGGVFEWIRDAWKKLGPPSPRSLIPYQEPQTAQKRPLLPSIFEAFKPPAEGKKRSTLPAMFEAFKPPVAKEEKATPLIFQHIKPTLPVQAPERILQPPTIWQELFEAPAEAATPAPSVSEMFAPFAGPPPEAAPLPPRAPSSIIRPIPIQELRYYEPEEWGKDFPDIQEKTQGRMPLWVVYNMGWRVPTEGELVNQIAQAWDLIAIFEEALQTIDDPYWAKLAAEAAHTGEPATLEIEALGQVGDPYRDLVRYLGVPEHVIEFYAAQPDGAQLMTDEILEPMLERVGKAMEVLKPPPLKGWFLIGRSGGEYWLKYKEARFPQGIL